jgi:hypothetical protein
VCRCYRILRVNKGKRGEEDIIWRSCRYQTYPFKRWKIVIFSSNQNEYPRPWHCSPRPYESNDPRNTQIRVGMRKWKPKYHRHQKLKRVSVGPEPGHTVWLYHPHPPKAALCQTDPCFYGLRDIFGAELPENLKPSARSLFKEGRSQGRDTTPQPLPRWSTTALLPPLPPS